MTQTTLGSIRKKIEDVCNNTTKKQDVFVVKDIVGVYEDILEKPIIHNEENKIIDTARLIINKIQNETIEQTPLQTKIQQEQTKKKYGSMFYDFDDESDDDNDESDDNNDENDVIGYDNEGEEETKNSQPTFFGGAEKEKKKLRFADEFNDFSSDDYNNENEEYEDDDDDDDNDDYEYKINNTNKKGEFRNIVGMSLNNPYYFQKKIEEKAPYLFVNEDKNIESYSRLCPSNLKKQPVVIDKKQLDEIQKKYPNYLKPEDVLKYGKNNEEAYYYICPRYWCLLTDSYISEEDVKAGKCGGIIPKNAKVVPEGKYVYEFFGSESEHGTKNNYIKHYPGFHKDKANGYCIPCCYKKWKTPKQIKQRQTCQMEMLNGKTTGNNPSNVVSALQEQKDETPEEDEKEEVVSKKIQQQKGQKDDIIITYIKDPNNFPMKEKGWGYLPIPIQNFLHELSSDCRDVKKQGILKLGHPCFLRHSIEINNKQSFIACIADIIYYKKIEKVPTIEEMKEIMIKTLTLDIFITLQNANLITIFASSSITTTTTTTNINEEHKQSKLFSKLDKTKDEDMDFFKKVVNAFENFKLFLRNENSILDHTYLWDFITRKNTFFNNGINLIILEISENDITSNVEILCPTNHYQTSFYDPRKSSIFVIKKGEYYEPVYSYLDYGKKIQIKKIFSEYDPTISPSLKFVIQKIIKPIIGTRCLPQPSMQMEKKIDKTIYRFKKPLLLNNLVEILIKDLKYTIKKQIINFEGKVIGVVSSIGNTEGFVPCFPSSVIDVFDYAYITSPDIWKPYTDTYMFLETLYRRSREKIPCKPIIKISEYDTTIIVGFLTLTNQFVPFSEPIEKTATNDEMDIIDGTNYLINENKFSEVDEKRIEYINKIKIETNLYNNFKNLIKILINKNSPESLQVRESILENVNNVSLTYLRKLQNIEELLHKITDENNIVFDDEKFKSIYTLKDFIQNENANQNQNQNEKTKNPTIQTVFPKINIMTQKDNSNIYFKKLADEFVRFDTTRYIMFQPEKSFITFNEVYYSLHKNEIMLLQSLITKEYFETFEIIDIDEYYLKYKSFDDTEPYKMQINYTNQIDIYQFLQKKISENDEISSCQVSVNPVNSIFWKNCFPKNKYNELKYDETLICNFSFISDILERVKGIQVSLIDVKTVLYNEYMKYYNYSKEYEKKIISILNYQGKKTFIKLLSLGKIDFETLIFNEKYYFTNLDVILLMNYYKINSIFISSKNLMETSFKYKYFIIYFNETEKLGKNEDNEFIFITCRPILEADTIPKYSIIENIQTKKINIHIKQLSKFSECFTNFSQVLKDHEINQTNTSNFKYFLDKFDIKWLNLLKGENEIEKPNITKKIKPAKPDIISKQKMIINKKTKKVRQLL